MHAAPDNSILKIQLISTLLKASGTMNADLQQAIDWEMQLQKTAINEGQNQTRNETILNTMEKQHKIAQGVHKAGLEHHKLLNDIQKEKNVPETNS